MATLEKIIEVATEIDATALAAEACALRNRLAEGRFFVACVGQFKRGKSSLLNALVGAPVLPVGVVPVTAVVTVVRFGEVARARVRFGDTWKDVPIASLAEFVSESGNPENEKGVTGVEVFTPSESLRSGMCLVDTPGLGSVFAHNTDATRALVPHIDAALLVIGADPPLSGAELDLVQETSEQVERLVVVMNKSDRLTDEERVDGKAFAEREIHKRLGRCVDVLEVSAKERIASGATRDWPTLEQALEEFSRDAAVVVHEAELRGCERLTDVTLRELRERQDALERPREASLARIAQMRSSIEDAERTLRDMAYLFTSIEIDLAKAFNAERDAFVRASGAVERFERVSIESSNVFDVAQQVARESIEEWRTELAPRAERLYAEATRRLVEAAREFLSRVSMPETFEPTVGFRAKPHFHFTDMLTVASPKLTSRLGLTRTSRFASEKRDASAYLERLIETNSARVANDLIDQVRESRRGLEADLRAHLRRVCASAERALSAAEKHRSFGEESVRAAIAKLVALRHSITG